MSNTRLFTGTDKSRTEQALGVFEACLANGVPLTAALAWPIIRELCKSPTSIRALCKSTVTKVTMDRAMAIVQWCRVANTAAPRSETLTGPPEQLMYFSVLRSLVSVGDLANARLLCLDIRQRRLKLTEFDARTLIQSMMRKAGSHKDAFACYKHVRLIRGRPSTRRRRLRLSDYKDTTMSFIRMEYPSSIYPPARLAFALQEDCHSEYPEVDDILLQLTLLRRYQMDIRKLRPGFVKRNELHLWATVEEGIIIGVREIHKRLANNRDIEKGLLVCNAVMATYIWEELRAGRFRHKNNNSSVSIIFDDCGWRQHQDAAIWICTELQAEQFPFNKKN